MTVLDELVDVTRSEWGGVSTGAANNFDPSSWSKVEVHHSAGKSRGTSLGQVKALERAMIAGGRFSDIWYHLIVLEDGRVVEGRGVRRKNSTRPNLTLLLMGNYTTIGATDTQLASVARIVAAVRGQLTWHAERARQAGTPPTACCGAALIGQLTKMRTEMQPTPTPTMAPTPPVPVTHVGVWTTSSPPVCVIPADRGQGYAVVCADGGVFAFGGFTFAGSAAPHLTAGDRIVSACKTPGGYLLLAASGGLFAFGDARYAGRVSHV